MNALRKLRFNALLSSSLIALFGLLLLLFPSVTASLCCYVGGSFIILLGIGRIVEYFRDDPMDALGSELPAAALFIAVGILVILNTETLLQWMPVVLSTVVIYSGLVMLQRMLDAFRIGEGARWPLALVLGVLCTGVGVFLLVNPPCFAGTLLYSLLGAGLLYSGLGDLAILFFLTRHSRRKAEQQDSTAISESTKKD